MKNALQGSSFIGWSRPAGSGPCSRGVNPATGRELEPPFHAVGAADVQRAVDLAAGAFPEFSGLPGPRRAVFLRAIAAGIEGRSEEIIARARLETALPQGRLEAETARTTGQLRMFAALIEEDSWLDVRIVRADPDRRPQARPDMRSMLVPLGPVALFCPANFPLAYSLAGGDCAAALAAGCPVVAVVHEGHPGTAEIVASIMIRAARETEMPEGVFSALYGGGPALAPAVVVHPAIQAVAFTGSRAGGTALMALAASRPQPIPVFAEMSSINPVVVLPGALARGEEELAGAFFASLTLCTGQYCTNPGLLLLPPDAGDAFLASLTALAEAAEAGIMVHAGLAANYGAATSALAALPGVETLFHRPAPPGSALAFPAVFLTTAAGFLGHPQMQREMFGPATLVVRGDVRETETLISRLEGQLTGSIHASDAELAAHPALLAALRRKTGRLICNGFPTGLEVCASTVHGGPWPATSDGRSSAVGPMAITRFCRPAAWQDFPDAALPAALKDRW